MTVAPASVAATASVTVAAPSAGLVTPATLTVSPTTVLLTPLLGGSLTLTASGGPVSWSIAEPASLLGKLTVSPASGTLSAGASVTVTITVSVLLSLDTQLTVQPGGQPVTVLLGLASTVLAKHGASQARGQPSTGRLTAGAAARQASRRAVLDQAARAVARSACARRSRTARAGSCAP